MAKATHDIRLVITSRASSYGEGKTFTARVACIGARRDGDDVELYYPDKSQYDNPLSGFADLEITAYQEERDGEGTTWYGFSIDYRDVYSIDLARAEDMVKTLRTLRRKMDKLAERFGHPRDFAAYLAHVADAIGATSASPFGHHEDEITYNGTFYRWVDARGLTHLLDKM